VFDLNIQIESLAGIRRALEKTPELIELLIEDTATTLRNLVIGGTPVGDTGDLKKSWSAVERTATGFTFGTDKDYATVLEEGGYTGVGPRTIALADGIFSRQAPGGIIAPLLQDEQVMDKILKRIASELVRSISRAAT
jgi:hypothetical protein